MMFDLVVLAALVVSCLIAFLRGFIREVLTVLGVIGGAFAAVSAGPVLAPVVLKWLAPENGGAEKAAEGHEDKLFGVLPYDMAADLIAYGGVFVVVVILLSIVSHLMSGWARKIGLGAVDRALGVVFGIARAALLLGLLYLPVHILVKEEDLPGWVRESHTRIYVEAVSAWIDGFLPKSVTDDMSAAADKASASMTDATRRKLEDLDILDGGKEGLKDGHQKFESAPSPEPGYGDGERGGMDDLIRKETEKPAHE